MGEVLSMIERKGDSCQDTRDTLGISSLEWVSGFPIEPIRHPDPLEAQPALSNWKNISYCDRLSIMGSALANSFLIKWKNFGKEFLGPNRRFGFTLSDSH